MNKLYNDLDFLNRGERYAEARGDEYFFKEWYTKYREHYDVEYSVWHTLRWLYDDDTANLVKYQYWGPALCSNCNKLIGDYYENR